MALAMSRPWKHPRTGIYWLRKRVPEHLIPVLGKREEKRSLKTRDPAQAKRLHLEALIELEARWANLKAGPRVLTEVEAHELAVAAHDRWLAMHRDNPSQQAFWRTDLYERLWLPPAPLDLSDLRAAYRLDLDSLKVRELEDWSLGLADECLTVHGLVVDPAGRLKLARAISAAVQRASLTLERYAQGDFGDQPVKRQLPIKGREESPRSGDKGAVQFKELVEGWASEKRPTEKTLYSWQRVFDQLASFVGHCDAARLSADDLIRWKTELIGAGLHPKTIRDGRIAPVKAVLQWGVDNRRLAANPAERIVVDVRIKAADTIRSFTDEEARTILKAALQERDPVRRWVPWLCAYSGARLSEVCQLRAEDVVQVEGIWCLKLDPGAGSLKNRNSERAIPLHPAVLESGFLDFVRSVRSGPLFADLSPDKFGSRGGNGTKMLGRWVRGLGLVDPRLSPSHSWRHRMKTLGRRHGLALDMVNAITGHGRKTVADSYGEFPMAALHREIQKIPAIDVQ